MRHAGTFAAGLAMVVCVHCAHVCVLFLAFHKFTDQCFIHAVVFPSHSDCHVKEHVVPSETMYIVFYL